jgi:hypothetical protein
MKIRSVVYFLFFIFYLSEAITKYFSGISINRAYYLIIIFFFLLFIINFLLKKIINQFIFLILFSLFTAVFIFEVQSYFWHIKKNTNIPKNINYDNRSLFQILEHYDNLKIKVTIPFRATRNSLNEFDKNLFPLSGISKIFTVTCNENGFFPEYFSDRYGFNNNDELWENKNKKRIMLVGDSYAIGHCVNPSDNFAGNLSNLFSNINFFNLGYGDSGPLIELATIKEYINVVNPNLVLWFYTEDNDIDNLTFELRDNILSQYLLENFSQDLVNKQEKIDEILLKIFENQKNLKTYKNVGRDIPNFFSSVFYFSTTRSLVNKILQKKNNSLQKLPYILEEARNITRHNNAEFVFVYLPGYQRYSQKINNDEFRDRKKVLNIVQNLGIKIIDANQMFDNLEAPKKLFPFEQPGHYNIQGYKNVSILIKDKLNTFFPNIINW